MLANTMPRTNRFALILESLAELAPEIEAAQADPRRALPSLSEVLGEYAPLPREALFLGLAMDGLPVLLNLRDPLPGPLLIAGDAGSGKTALLQVIARGVERGHNPKDVKYGIISPHLGEWEGFASGPNCAKILHTQDPTATDFLVSLVNWAHSNKGSRQYNLLLIDDLEAISRLDSNVHQNLRWLLLRGPSRGVWPFVTLNAGRARQVRPWLDAFRTRLFGRIRNEREAQMLIGVPNTTMDALVIGAQFAIREGSQWLIFWIPNLD